MTDEQIKQNAEDYINENTQGVVIDANIRNFLLDVYLAGAHSRDEEVNQLENALRNVNEYCHQLRNKVYELRNPWTSVEERLPEEHSKVLIMFCNGTVTYNDYIGVGDINYMKAHSKTITHWMLIPQIKKGE